MKCIPAFLLLFLFTSLILDTAKGQTPAPVKTDNVEIAEEEQDIYCFFPEIIDAKFPGGTQAWQSFIRKNLYYPRAAWSTNIQGTVVVAFVVEPDGRVAEIKAVSGPMVLRQAAMDVIKKSPKWIAAVQSGRKVKSYKKQPIIFRLAEEKQANGKG